MKIRRKKKAWDKYYALMTGEPSHFGRITAREKKAAVEYLMWWIRWAARKAKTLTIEEHWD